MDEMMKAISKYANGTYMKVEWDNGQLVLEGKIDTIYESNNGLEEEDEGYKEFYACAFSVENILNNQENRECHIGGLVEISMENEPTLIALDDGSIIWKKWYKIYYGYTFGLKSKKIKPIKLTIAESININVIQVWYNSVEELINEGEICPQVNERKKLDMNFQ